MDLGRLTCPVGFGGLQDGLGWQEEAARPLSQMPGPKWPLVGAMPPFVRFGFKRVPETFQHFYDNYGMICDISMPGEKQVVVYDPREWLKVFQKEGPYPEGIASQLWIFKYLAKKHGKTMPAIVSSGEHWRRGRHVLQQDLFSLKAASSYVDLITDAADEVMEGLKQRSALGPVSFQDEMMCAIVDVFTAAVFGKSIGASSYPQRLSPRAKEWMEASLNLTPPYAEMIVSPWVQFKPEAFRCYRTFEKLSLKADEATADLVEECLQRYENFEGPENLLPFTARVHRRGAFSRENLSQEIGGILQAGSDTTFHVLLWNVLSLAAHPEVQEKLRREVAEVLGPGGAFSREKLGSMPYMRAVLRETYRHAQPGPLFSFRTLAQDLDLCGYMVPAGYKVLMAPGPIQMDPRIVEDPQVYRPERFLPDAVASRAGDPARALLDHGLLANNFSHGARKCLGARLADLEIMTLLSKFVSNFRFHLDPPMQSWVGRVRTLKLPSPMPTVKFTPL